MGSRRFQSVAEDVSPRPKTGHRQGRIVGTSWGRRQQEGRPRLGGAPRPTANRPLACGMARTRQFRRSVGAERDFTGSDVTGGHVPGRSVACGDRFLCAFRAGDWEEAPAIDFTRVNSFPSASLSSPTRNTRGSRSAHTSRTQTSPYKNSLPVRSRSTPVPVRDGPLGASTRASRQAPQIPVCNARANPRGLRGLAGWPVRVGASGTGPFAGFRWC